MSQLLNRFSFNAVEFSGQVVACLAIIWLLVIACAIMSVFQQPFQRRQRIFWMTLIICLPGLGLLAYLPFSFPKENQSVWLKNKPQSHR